MSTMTTRIKLLASAIALGLAAYAAPAGAEYKGLPRTFLWNPGTVSMVDTAEYKKDGPYTIGFSNASQADLWLVTFSQGRAVPSRPAQGRDQEIHHDRRKFRSV
jgi:ABC-type sugar transport system substrate-binding protein